MECDGKGDHDLRRVLNKIALIGLLLNGNMKKFLGTRRCPGTSYLNTAERAISLINIMISSLTLAFGTDTDEWILSEILEGVVCMKDVRSDVSQYDTDILIALITLSQRLQSTKTRILMQTNR